MISLHPHMVDLSSTSEMSCGPDGVNGTVHGMTTDMKPSPIHRLTSAPKAHT